MKTNLEHYKEEIIKSEKCLDCWFCKEIKLNHCNPCDIECGEDSFKDKYINWLLQEYKDDNTIIKEKPIYNGHGIYFCPKCHGSLWQNKDESNFCFRCGNPIVWEGD